VGKLKYNQKGFTAVEGLLIVLILVVIGAVGYMVYHNHHKTTTAAATTTSSTKPATSTKTTTSTTTQPASTYAGWKTYTSAEEGASFKYPANWTATVPDYSHGTQPPQGSDYVNINSPDNNFQVHWVSDYGDPNGCTAGQSFSGITYSDVTAVPSVSNLYYVQVLDTNNSFPTTTLELINGSGGKAPTVGSGGTICPTLAVFKSKNSNRYLQLYMSYSTPPSSYTGAPYPQPSAAELQTIKNILLSFSYN
jgi:Tfp pilus assembly protein PilE